ncbi:hypothetical protein ACKKBG_A33050 [Auxenochlorella protothecoides x Auxenochlorella symbiontica]
MALLERQDQATFDGSSKAKSKTRRAKSKKIVRLRLEEVYWQGLLADQTAARAFFSDATRREDVLRFLTGGPSCAYGLLCTSSMQLRLVILSLIERDSRLMLVGASSDTVRAFYEAVRDASWRHLSLPPSLAPAGQLSAADVAGLRRATLGALGAMLVVGDAVTIDTRLFRTHVQFLLNLLTAVTSDGWEVAAAAEALGALESTYPGLLMEAGWYLAERVESAAAAEGPLTPAQNGEVSLAALVLSHAAGMYNEQQRGWVPPLLSAADLAAAPGTLPPSPSEAEWETPSPPAAGLGSLLLPEYVSEDGSLASEARGGAGGTARGVLRPLGDLTPSASFASSASAPEGAASQTLELHLLERKGRELLRRFRVPAHLTPGGGEAGATGEAAAVRAAAAGDAATAPPEDRAAAAAPPGDTASGEARPGEARAASPEAPTRPPPPVAPPRRPVVLLSEAARRELGEATLCLLRLLAVVANPEALRARLPPLLAASAVPDAALRRAFFPLLRAPTLGTALALHDAAPARFARCAPELVRRVLRALASPARGEEDRVTAARWLHALHARAGAGLDGARAAHDGGGAAQSPSAVPGPTASPLAASWALLLPLPDDPPRVFAARVRTLAAALEAGAGDPWHAVAAVLAWDGLCAAAADEGNKRAATAAALYALRLLAAAGGARPELALALHVAALHAAATRPAGWQLVRPTLEWLGCEEGAAGAKGGDDGAAKHPSLLAAQTVPAFFAAAEAEVAAQGPAAFASLAAPGLASGWRRRGLRALSDARDSLSRAGSDTLGRLRGGRSPAGSPAATPTARSPSASTLGGRGDDSESGGDEWAGAPSLTPSPNSSSALSRGHATDGGGMRKRLSARLRSAASSSLSAAAAAALAAAAVAAGMAAETAEPQPDLRAADREACLDFLAARSGGARLPVWPGDGDAATAGARVSEHQLRWAASPTTWAEAARVACTRDPLAVRHLALAGGLPPAALRWYASYFGAYRRETEAHELSAAATGAAALALCHAALLRCDGKVDECEDGDVAGVEVADVGRARAKAGGSAAGPRGTRDEQGAALDALLRALEARFPDGSVRERAAGLRSLRDSAAVMGAAAVPTAMQDGIVDWYIRSALGQR